MQSKVGYFQHETAVDHAVARLEIAVRPDFRRMYVGHGLRDETRRIGKCFSKKKKKGDQETSFGPALNYSNFAGPERSIQPHRLEG